jgi:hypothetical protein
MIYVILDNTTGEAGKVINTVLSETPRNSGWIDVTTLSPRPEKHWAYDGAVFTFDEALPIDYGSKITKRAFLVRIDPEMAAIDLASIDNPAGATAERMGQANLRKFMRYVENSSFIDLATTLVSEGLNALVSAGLLSAARLNEVINTPVTATET